METDEQLQVGEVVLEFDGPFRSYWQVIDSTENGAVFAYLGGVEHMPRGEPHRWLGAAHHRAATRVPFPEHLLPATSDRGFKRLPEVPGVRGYGGSVSVYESSGAAAPRIWLQAVSGTNTERDGQSRRAIVHLELEQAAQLRDQLDWLIRNHYQVTS